MSIMKPRSFKSVVEQYIKFLERLYLASTSKSFAFLVFSLRFHAHYTIFPYLDARL